MQCRAWSTGVGTGKPFSYSTCCQGHPVIGVGLVSRRTFMNVHSFCADKRDMNIQLPDFRLPR